MWAPTVLFSRLSRDFFILQHHTKSHKQTQIAHLKILKIEHVFVLHVNPGHPIIRSFNKSWVGAQPSIYLFFHPIFSFYIHASLDIFLTRVLGLSLTLAFSKKSTAGPSPACFLQIALGPYAAMSWAWKKWRAPSSEAFKFLPEKSAFSEGVISKKRDNKSPAQACTIPSLLKKFCSHTLGLRRCQRNP